MHEHEDGTVILEPAVVLSELELRYRSDTKLQQQIAYAREHPEQSRPRPPRRTT